MGLQIAESLSSRSRTFASTTKARQAPGAARSPITHGRLDAPLASRATPDSQARLQPRADRSRVALRIGVEVLPVRP